MRGDNDKSVGPLFSHQHPCRVVLTCGGIVAEMFETENLFFTSELHCFCSRYMDFCKPHSTIGQLQKLTGMPWTKPHAKPRVGCNYFSDCVHVAGIQRLFNLTECCAMFFLFIWHFLGENLFLSALCQWSNGSTRELRPEDTCAGGTQCCSLRLICTLTERTYIYIYSWFYICRFGRPACWTRSHHYL